MEFLKLLMGLRNPVLDYAMMGVSYVGLPAVLIGAILWIYLNGNKKNAHAMMLSMLFSQMVCQGMKLVFRVPRPWVLEPDTSVFYPVTMAVASAGGYSFPSIHVQASTAFFGSVLHYNNKKAALRVLSCCFLVLVPFSRMYLGCHTPKDVAVSFAIATLFNFIIWRLSDAPGSMSSGDSLSAFLTAGLALILIALTAGMVINKTTEFRLSSDALQTGGTAAGYALSAFLEGRLLRFQTQGSPVHRILRFAIAFAGFFLITKGLKLLGSELIFLTAFRYFAAAVWMFFVTPFLCLRFRLMKAGGAS